MGECIILLADATIFSPLDTYCRNWNVDITVIDQDETAFSSHQALFLLTNAFWTGKSPRDFSRSDERFHTEIDRHFELVYFIEIEIFLRTPEQRIDHV